MSGKKRGTFFSEAIKNLNTVGTFTYSSRFLIDKTIQPIDFSKDIIIVELGAGNGCFTKTMLNKMTANSRIIAFELSSYFVDMIKAEIDDDRLLIIDDSVELLEYFLNKEGITEVDHVVSALPLVVFPDELIDGILKDCTNFIKSGGYYVQISYSTLKLDHLKMWFNNVKTKYTIRNGPPAFSFWCKND